MSTGSSELVIVGRIRKPHGIRGEVMVDLATDDPGEVYVPGRRFVVGAPDESAAPLDRALVLRSAREFKGGLLAHFAGIHDRNEAEPWRDHHLLVPMSELAPLERNEVYYHELEGMVVARHDGTPLGTVAAFYELPQGLLLEVARDGSAPVLIPYRDGVVVRVERDARRIVVDPPPGLIEE